MANKVTGNTDTTGALSIAPSTLKSVLVVGTSKATGAKTNTVFSISGTADAAEKFGADSAIVGAVKALIKNGVDYIYGVIAGTDGYEDALKATLGEKSIKFIVLDNYDTANITVLKEHLAEAEGEDLFRYALVAVESDDNDEMKAFAKTMDDSRMFVVGPTFVDNGTAVSRTVVSAGVTGAVMTETDDPALPVNGVTVKGIGNVNRAVLESERKTLADGGVTVLYNDGTPTIHRLVTSYTKDAIWQEGTTRFIADYVLENNQNTLRANYKRTKNVARILNSIKTTIKGCMENYEGLEIIENFDPSTLTVVKDPTDLYGALVDYEFDVVTPLYTITINQHMKL